MRDQKTADELWAEAKRLDRIASAELDRIDTMQREHPDERIDGHVYADAERAYRLAMKAYREALV